MTSARDKRAAVVLGIEAALTGRPGVTVYPFPHDNPVVPFVILAPRAPYREPQTFTQEAVHLAVWIGVSQAPGMPGMDELDDLVDVVMGSESVGLLSVAGFTEISVASIRPTTANGNDVLVAEIHYTL